MKTRTHVAGHLSVEASEKPMRDADIAKAELDQQQAKVFHIDTGKIMVGYNFQGPVGGSANIINRFQGVSDATASSAGKCQSRPRTEGTNRVGV